MAENVEALRQKCLLAAEKLSESRQRYAKELDQKISESMHTLSMEHGEFSINITSDPDRMLSPIGYDSINCLVSTNPGQPLQPLRQSRIRWWAITYFIGDSSDRRRKSRKTPSLYFRCAKSM